MPAFRIRDLPGAPLMLLGSGRALQSYISILIPQRERELGLATVCVDLGSHLESCMAQEYRHSVINF